MKSSNAHTSHPRIINRLKRAEGHLRSVVDMLENQNPCLDIAQQLHAVQNAITNAKRELIHDHLDHCLDDGNNQVDLNELREIAKYL
jgi:DNA-binding FrmR family transcriptional regulator